MTQRIHFFAGLLATLTIACFFSATLFSELLGSTETIVSIKAWIVMPGLFLLISAIAAPAATSNSSTCGQVKIPQGLRQECGDCYSDWVALASRLAASLRR